MASAKGLGRGLGALMGDFNDEPDSAPIKMLCESLTDLTTNVGRTFHNYGRCKEMPMKIDYVFTSVKDIEYSAELVSDGPFDGIYPSDHYPVVVTAEYIHIVIS